MTAGSLTKLPKRYRSSMRLPRTSGSPAASRPESATVVGSLGLARDTLPNTAIHLLTNGRGFARAEIADAWAAVGHPDLCAGIPIYAAVDTVHDYVVQAPGAFDETVLGILRLKERGQRVEVRVVLHAITAPRIVETARWFARNLPFVDHVALMGLENTGFAIANHGLLWIDPIDYRAGLALAVDILDAARVPVSVYNLPFCVLDRDGVALRQAVDLRLEERLSAAMRQMRRQRALCRFLLDWSAEAKPGDRAALVVRPRSLTLTPPARRRQKPCANAGRCGVDVGGQPTGAGLFPPPLGKLCLPDAPPHPLWLYQGPLLQRTKSTCGSTGTSDAKRPSTSAEALVGEQKTYFTATFTRTGLNRYAAPRTHNPELDAMVAKVRASGLEIGIFAYDHGSNKAASRLHEKQLIAKYGRRDLGTGTLFNKNNGG